MKVYLTNTLKRCKELFTPLDKDNVRMYVCGPTVYDRPHLGNARSAVVYDVLFRLLQKVYKKVTYVRNITDVDDKIIKASNESGCSINDITTKMTQYYHDDIMALNCISPTHEPRATQHISMMVAMIEELLKNNNAYVAESHVLFSVESFKEYGKLSARTVDEMIAGARVEIAPYKKNPADFVLWKSVEKGNEQSGYQSPWGLGRPGWHIECSAMSKKFLGDEFDIHGGGADLMFPHHENEVAQSECANHSKFVRYWVHNGFLTVDGVKMSKSLGNFKTVREVLDDGVEGVVIRYIYLTTHYKKPLDFNQKAVDDAKKAIERFRLAAKDADESSDFNEVLEIIADDMNTPGALAKLHEYATKALKGDNKFAAKLVASAKLLGLDFSEQSVEVPKHIIEIAEDRIKAKKNMDWELADKLRDQIKEQGYTIKDTKDGYELL